MLAARELRRAAQADVELASLLLFFWFRVPCLRVPSEKHPYSSNRVGYRAEVSQEHVWNKLPPDNVAIYPVSYSTSPTTR